MKYVIYIDVSDLARDNKINSYFPSFRSVKEFNVNFLENKKSKIRKISEAVGVGSRIFIISKHANRY